MRQHVAVRLLSADGEDDQREHFARPIAARPLAGENLERTARGECRLDNVEGEERLANRRAASTSLVRNMVYAPVGNSQHARQPSGDVLLPLVQHRAERMRAGSNQQIAHLPGSLAPRPPRFNHQQDAVQAAG